MSSPDLARPLTAPERRRLVDLAWEAIGAGFDAPFLGVDLASQPPRLVEPGASFVTLTRGGRLRGCMGRLEASRPLAEDVAANARASAWFDPRFPPVEPGELADLALDISVLAPSVPLPAASEADLVAALRPGIDGLIVREGERRATYLPAVWAQFADPREFVTQLKRKAGLAPGHWSDSIRFERYATESIPGGVGAGRRPGG